MQHANLAYGSTIADEVKIDLYVLGALVLDRVRRHVDGANIVAEHNRNWRRWSMKLVEELANPSSLATTLATARYSASTLERETVCSRFEDHETRLSPR
jgi:hypothetical protein